MSEAVSASIHSDQQKTMSMAGNTTKRDELITDEKRFQQQWGDQKLFESNAPSTSDYPPSANSSVDLQKKFPKWMGTMAYPYMNGTGHMGHAFTMSRVEFGSRVARMQGKRALFPQGWHCTGMPIKACADKLTREIEMFGSDFEGCPDESEMTNGGVPSEPPAPTQQVTKEDVTKFSAKKSKANAKTVKKKWQWQIMEQQGVKREDIKKFADPHHWLQYFPPLWKRDMTAFGCGIDWRRSMVTTDANPFYDSFVRWQVNRLKELGKIKFGKRYTVYSPKDMQACMDHDRSEGEGVGVQEYTALKLKVKEWPEAARTKLQSKLPSDANVFFIPATLRPETMYGQNCCFVGPTISYGIFKVGNEYFFCSDRAARNMAYQNIIPQWGVVEKVAELQGADVVGTLVHAPLSIYKDGIRILPMETVKASKGTGVVTCVPSDSPDDYATIIDLLKKPEYYNIKKEWAELEIVPIIETPTYGNLIAKKLVEDMKINSPKDVKQLTDAKEIAYKEGFYKGTMVIGDFKGESVQEAKGKVRNQLIASGEAFNYAEPDGFVLSRSGDDCVAAYLDQWFVNYGKTESGGDGAWQQQVVDYVNDGLNTFSDDVKAGFQGTLDWLANWSVARPYGLGTRLPWDHTFLVESLSDSTVYMGYYTVAHLLHTDIFGKSHGPLDIKVDELTDEVWDYVFFRSDEVKSSIPQEKLLAMRREFEYWYPWDVRVSGKDLIQNHLTFCLYHHIALFSKDKWPKAIRANGHLLLNSEKMSKSTGNFLTLSESINKFGADATRIALADAGDTVDDANFDETVANATILRMYELREWCTAIVKDAVTVQSPAEYIQLRDSKKYKNTDIIQRNGPLTFLDNLFNDEMNTLVSEAVANYDGYLFKAALKSALYEFTGARDQYRSGTNAAGIGMHVDLTRRYVELQALLLAPVAPHWAEGQWLDVLGKTSSITLAPFPSVPSPDAALTAAREYARSVSGQITSAEGAQMKKIAKGKTSTYDPKGEKVITIFAAKSYPKWQDDAIEYARQSFEGMSIDMKTVAKKLPKADSKRAMPFITTLKKQLDGGKSREEVFERKLGFDEVFVLKEMAVALKQAVQKCKTVEIVSVDEGGKAGEVVGGTEGVKVGERREALPVFAEHCTPGNPTFHFENV